jgi:hypothetical protein
MEKKSLFTPHLDVGLEYGHDSENAGPQDFESSSGTKPLY